MAVIKYSLLVVT